MSNEKVRELTGQQLLGDIIRERRLRWCGGCQLTFLLGRRSLGFQLIGRSRIDWIQTIKQDLNRGGLKWEDLLEVTANRVHWKQLTALCAVGAGGSKVETMQQYPATQQPDSNIVLTYLLPHINVLD